MTRIFWDLIFLISGTFSMSVVLNGSLFTLGAGQGNSSISEMSIFINRNSTSVPNTSTSSSAETSNSNTTNTSTVTTTTSVPPVKSSLLTLGAEHSISTIIEMAVSISTNSTAAPNTSLSYFSATSSRKTTTTTIATTTANMRPVKITITHQYSWHGPMYSNGVKRNLMAAHLKSIHMGLEFVAAAVRSHFDDCPDSHSHFCFHGTCRFLILEETPACVCHPGFVGMRCELADLLAVVATNHRPQTVATVLVLCVILCVLIMVLCTLLHCWWRQDWRRRRQAHHYIPQKHGASNYPTESVV